MLVIISFCVALVCVAVVFGYKISKLNEHVDDLFHKAFQHESTITYHNSRLDAHYNDIVNLSKQHDELADKVDEYHKGVNTDFLVDEQPELENLVPEQEEEEEELSNKELELLERRECFAHLRAHGVSLHDAADKMHISYSTAKRYEKWRIDNKK